VVGRGETDIVHDQSLFVSEARLALDAGITKRLSASLVVPIRIVNTNIRYFDTAGTEVMLVRDSVHHRNETVTGLADPMLLGGASTHVGGLRLTGRAGFTIPIGRTEEDPFVAADAERPHQHIQMGSGTVNPVLAIEAAHARGVWRFGAFAFTQQTLYANGKGYQAGDRYAGGVSARRGFGRLGLRGGIEVQAETAEQWDGIVHTDDGNRGRLDAMAGIGGSWAASDTLSFDLDVKVPFVTHVVGGQLDMPAIVQVGASWSFGAKAKAKAHEHDHEHGDHDEHDHEHGDHHDHDHAGPAHPDTTGLDVADLGAPGEGVDLVPVPGTVTIFDFWATWCEPCKKLEPALVDVVREHRGKVALRRIDVVDWDSQATARHLTPGGYDLPHIKIFDAHGKLLLEKTSKPGKLPELIAEIHRVVDAAAAQVKAPAPPSPSTTPGAPMPPSTTPPAAPTTPAAPPTPPPAPPSTTPPAAPAQPTKPPAAPTKPPTAARPVAPVRVAIQSTAKGFLPAVVTVPRGRPVTFVFTRVGKHCGTEVVLQHEGKRLVTPIPADRPVELTLTFAKAGTIHYACAMDMLHGTIEVR
jgi:thiol-disulfide isomerase/thioredoxin